MIVHDLNTKTGRIYAAAFDILEKSPEGMRWSELNKRIEKLHPDLHPKTINGCVWKLPEKFPNQVYKPKRGIFKLK
jgi:hypothetical protein